MDKLYISLLLLFAVFGAFCFNAGHRRAYRIALKGLLKGQLDFLARRIAWLGENRAGVGREDFERSLFSYETVGQLALGWYRSFRGVRDDRELRALKAELKSKLAELLALLEAVGAERGLGPSAFPEPDSNSE